MNNKYKNIVEFNFVLLFLSLASPLLSWRDVQHIIVKTSRAGHLSAPDWKSNAAGYNGLYTHSLTHTQYFAAKYVYVLRVKTLNPECKL